MRITLKQLSLFMVTAKFGNITKAAQSLFLSQSAASMAISELENQLGEPLFDRIGKKLILNENGKRLHPKAIDIIERIKEIENLVQTSKGELVGNISIGASTTIGNYLMPTYIQYFMKQYPKINISVEVANTDEIIEKIKNFSLDIGFIEDQCEESGINVSRFGEDQLIFFASPKHPLSKKRKITKVDLQEADWVVREKGSGTRRVFEKAIYPYCHTIKILLELGSIEAIKQFIKKGKGISCLSKYTLTSELAFGELVALPVNEILVKRHFYQLIHKEKHKTKILQAFINVCKEVQIS